MVYELHVGTFTPEGTLDAAVERLAHLVDLGVDVVELLPLASFPGEHNWGYDGVAPYSVHEAYGGPAALQRFVDAAHAHGLAVCLDVVYNHLGPDGNYLGEIGPYFTDEHADPVGPGAQPRRRRQRRGAPLGARQRAAVAARLPRRRAAARRRARAARRQRPAPARGDVARGRRARRGAPAGTLWLVAESDRNDPRHRHPARRRRRGRRARGARPVGRRRPPRAARRADRRDAGLLRRLRRPRRRWPRCCARRSSTTAPTPPSADAGTAGPWTRRPSRAGGSSPRCRPTTRSATGRRATGSPARSLDLDPGVLACGAAILLTSPWTPMLFMGEEWGARTPWQFFTDHTDPEHRARPRPRRPQGGVRLARLGRGRRARPAGPRDVPPLAAGLVRAGAGAARPAAGGGTAT